MSRLAHHEPATMYSTSTGAFRAALDRLLLQLHRARHDRTEARRLAVLIETIARRWPAEDPEVLADAIAQEIDA